MWIILQKDNSFQQCLGIDLPVSKEWHLYPAYLEGLTGFCLSLILLMLLTVGWLWLPQPLRAVVCGGANGVFLCLLVLLIFTS